MEFVSVDDFFRKFVNEGKEMGWELEGKVD